MFILEVLNALSNLNRASQETNTLFEIGVTTLYLKEAFKFFCSCRNLRVGRLLCPDKCFTTKSCYQQEVASRCRHRIYDIVFDSTVLKQQNSIWLKRV